jgi:8-oxo-dGTP pyrophosphatase MutT (NUDIX family)
VKRREEGGREAWVLPFSRLPKGFLRFLDEPPEPPSAPVPSATLILLRQGDAKLEVLLLERTPRSGFIPGAWVFPGGRVDPEDSDSSLLAFIDGLTEEDARETLTLEGGTTSALAFWAAAVRETFEETGVMISGGVESADSGELAMARHSLLEGKCSFLDILRSLGLKLDLRTLQYHGHWLTPECEPRRYETRFFMTEVGSNVLVTPHEKEMVAERWLAPGEAIALNQEGALPLVLPTLFTLQELLPYRTPHEAMEQLGQRPVPRRLPVPERAENGIRFRI